MASRRPASTGPSPAVTRKTTKGKTTVSRLKTTKVSARPPQSPSRPKSTVSKNKVTAHEDRKVAKRNAALNAMGGMKVDVFVRVRPAMKREKKDAINVQVDKESNSIVLLDKDDHDHRFNYDQVYGPESTQEEIFETAVSPIIEQVVRGLSCAIFAYGQTGSGKTHTMRGDPGADATQHGVIQRSLEMLLRRLPEQDYTDINLTVSFLEVYNEELMDMFRPESEKRLTLVDDDHRGTVCNGLTELPVTGVEDVLKLLNEADKHTKVSETKMNKFSNRAHRIFTIIAKFKRYDSDVISTLTFVDLAGSEDISRSGATGMTAREAAHINKSLLTLGRVINALAQSEKHIPYRDSKLTRLLSEALGGMCKTTFIACIAPVISSFTETQSTLRYAERAMEALNISQLPRWKQQEIIIDHLNRRLLSMEEEMAAQNRQHKEEMAKLTTKNEELEAARKVLAIQNYKLQRKIEKLQARKSKLKAGLSLMTTERDALHSQKETLREELLQTRRERDGYLRDRQAQSDVLARVRTMRETLLSAHRDTEESLTDDAVKLKEVVEHAIADIGDLHTEVARKKAISAHNEKVADEYRERMSTRLRDIIQTIVDFQHTNEQQQEHIIDGLLDLRNQDQSDCATNGLQLGALSDRASEMLKEIVHHCTITEDALSAQISRCGANVDTFSSTMSSEMANFKAAVSGQLQKLRTEAADLERQMKNWADSVATQIQDRESAVKGFSEQLTQGLSEMDAAIASSSSDHLAHLQEHKAKLDAHFVAEKKALEDDSTKLIANINEYVQRVVSDFKVKTTNRTKAVTTQLSADTDALSGESNNLLVSQQKLIGAERDRSVTFANKSAKALLEVKEGSATAAVSANTKLSAVVSTSSETDSIVEKRASDMLASKDAHVGKVTTQLSEMTKYVNERTIEHSKYTNSTEAAIETAVSTLKTSITDQHNALEHRHDELKNDLQHAGSDLKTSTAQTMDNTMEAEADSVNFVMQEIERDTGMPPQEKTYMYPSEFVATDSYDEILSKEKRDWDREVSILSGKTQAGKGPDFPGVVGPSDSSGLVDDTADVSRTADVESAITDAAWQSSAEDYVINEDGPEGEVDSLQPRGSDGDGIATPDSGAAATPTVGV